MFSPIGAITELYDISCIPQEEQANFTTMIADLWENSPNTWTSEDIVLSTEAANGPTALGMHYWIADPNNATSGKIFAMWDFSMSRMMEVTDMNQTFVVCSETGSVPDPVNPAVNSPWLYEPVLYVDGQKDGLLADEVFRFSSNGGNAPNTVRETQPCRPVAETDLFLRRATRTLTSSRPNPLWCSVRLISLPLAILC